MGAALGLFAAVVVLALAVAQGTPVEEALPRAMGAFLVFGAIGLCAGAIGRRVMAEAFGNEAAVEDYRKLRPLAEEMAEVRARARTEGRDGTAASPAERGRAP